MFWTKVAHAMGDMGGGGAAAGSGDGPLMQIIPIVMMIVVFYFILIRPQQKKTKELQSLVDSIKPGDKVITSGGLHGTVVETKDSVVTLDLGETKVKINRSSIQSVPSLEKKKKSGKDDKDSKDSKES